MSVEFTDVTELAGTQVSSEQLARMSHRYHWAQGFCRGKDVVEVACGSGQGLGLLSSVSKSLEAGDYSEEILSVPRAHYGSRIPLKNFDAQRLPFERASKDVVIIFEAIYYVPDVARFVQECRRVLRAGGSVLVATANKDLWDFNPSPLSYRYYGAADLTALLRNAGFEVELYGYMPVTGVSTRQRILRPLKKVAVKVGVMPKTLAGKRFLKKLVFGRLVEMPSELSQSNQDLEPPTPLSPDRPDRVHKVLYCRATLPG
jgi:ubiquinone/menaquinone biosynthesis C-methylase UbiE